MPLSYSQLQSYRCCPKQYEYMAVKKVQRRISAGESFGSSIHNTLQRWGELELRALGNIDPKKQLALFTEPAPQAADIPLDVTTLLTMWRECFIAEGHGSRAEMDAALLRGDGLLRQFFDWWSCTVRSVVTIESGFKLTIDAKDDEPIILSGRFDRIERTAFGLHIIDYKTSKARPQAEVDADLQLSIYALAALDQWKEPAVELTLLFLGEEGLIERTTTRNESQLKDALTSIRLLGERIASKDYAPTPGQVCKYCPYRGICPARMY